MNKIKKALKVILRFLRIELRIIKKVPKDHPEFWYDLDPELPHDMNAEALGAIMIVRKQAMVPYLNLETLYEQVIYCERNDIPGDFVECGVWKGGAVALMALSNLKHGKNRRHLHLFDIYDDICEPDPVVDGEKALKEIEMLTGRKEVYSGILRPVKDVYLIFGGPGSLEENRDLIESVIRYPAEYVHYYRGWFQDTIPANKDSISEIAILRLDGDLYASIKTCIYGLYDKVVKGGIVIVDDYGSYDGCRKAIDEFIAEKKIKVLLNYSNPYCRYWIKP
jgi:hypothetical protein